jgi:two-component system cell cycle sensor histidine kinase/response regulator CckA
MSPFRTLINALTPGRTPAPHALRLLVVDDEQTILAYVNRILTRAGYRPALASSGPEALRLAARMDRLDLLVTDVMMPEMSGDELAEKLRESHPDMKVLFQTGYSDRLFEEQTALADGESFIEKPYTIQSFQEAVSLLAFGVTRIPVVEYQAPALWTV